mmetsp:Transcript_20094/g.65311  ORF Transcript_20094/g.65311 Transcript_20094/m.65311 type:complete len:205 (+) Transcript_20094:655-1269(+)
MERAVARLRRGLRHRGHVRLEGRHPGLLFSAVRRLNHRLGAPVHHLRLSRVSRTADAHFAHACALPCTDRHLLLQDRAARHATHLGHRLRLRHLPVLLGASLPPRRRVQSPGWPCARVPPRPCGRVDGCCHHDGLHSMERGRVTTGAHRFRWGGGQRRRHAGASGCVRGRRRRRQGGARVVVVLSPDDDRLLAVHGHAAHRLEH